MEPDVRDSWIPNWNILEMSRSKKKRLLQVVHVYVAKNQPTAIKRVTTLGLKLSI